MRKLLLAAAAAILATLAARASDVPSFSCQAYGSVVECRAKDVGSLDVEWAAVWTAPGGSERVYRAAGDDFAFKLHHSGRTAVEMHPGGAAPLRCWATWDRGRVVFEKWEPHG